MESTDKVKADGNDIDLTISYEGQDRTGDAYNVHVVLNDEETESGNYRKSTIKVSLADSGEELYTLTTGDYEKEVGR